MPAQLKKLYNMKKIDDDRAEILIYGDIGEYWAEVTPKQFKKDLDALGDVKKIDVRVNSPGGDVTSGWVIYNQLKQHKAYITAYIDGIAASMGAFVIMAADKIYMSIAGMIMIHNAWGFAVGEAKELRAAADVLEKMCEIAVKVHSQRTGTSEDEVRKMMEETTYLTASEALEFGFIDEIIEYEGTKDIPELDEENKMLYIAGQQMNINKFEQSSMFMQKATGLVSLGYMKLKNKNQETPKGEEELKSLAELKEKHPDIYKQAVDEGKNEGITEERARMQAIDEVALPGTEAMVQKMKYEEPKSAALATVEIAKSYKQALADGTQVIEEVVTTVQQKTAGELMLDNMKKDSATGNVAAVPGTQGEITEQEKKMKRAEKITAAMNGGM